MVHVIQNVMKGNDLMGAVKIAQQVSINPSRVKQLAKSVLQVNIRIPRDNHRVNRVQLDII
jgi:hypothetical protein